MRIVFLYILLLTTVVASYGQIENWQLRSDLLKIGADTTSNYPYDLEFEPISERFFYQGLPFTSAGKWLNGVSGIYYDGNVGINTTNPSGFLTGTGSRVLEVSSQFGTGSSELNIRSNGVSTGHIAGISFSNASLRTAFLQSQKSNTSSLDGNLTFGTSDGTSNAVERMRIASDGNVGIGTNDPQFLLDVNNPGRIDGVEINNGNGNVNLSLGIGQNVLNESATGTFNTAIGFSVMPNITTGSRNVGIGKSALEDNASGVNNVGIGFNTLRRNVSGNSNVAVGLNCLRDNVAGIQNVAIGAQALLKNLANNNTAIGSQALNNNVSGIHNFALGTASLRNNIIGSYNVGIGVQALEGNIDGDRNIAIGENAAINLTNGSNNLIIGSFSSTSLTTGSGNTIIGNNINAPSTLSNNIIIADGDGNQRLRVDNQGNVGIGVTTPQTPLHVVTPNGADWQFTSYQDNTSQPVIRANGDRVFQATASGGDLYFGKIDNSGNLYARANGRDMFRCIGSNPSDLWTQFYGSVGIGTTFPDAILEVTSTSSGILIPRLTTAQRNAITATESELIYNSDNSQFEYWDGVQWAGLAGTFNGSITYPNEFSWSPTGQQDDVVLPSGTNTVFLNDNTNAGGFTITGIQNNGINEQITFINDKASNVTFSVNDASSLVDNRFYTQSGNFILNSGSSVTLRWSATKNGWVFISTF